MPLYKVEQEGAKPRLIEAGTPAEALRHAAKSTFTISGALTPSEVAATMQAGAAYEKAGEFAEDAGNGTTGTATVGDGQPGTDAAKD